MVQYIAKDRYEKYKDALSGLNDHNIEEVRKKLQDLGVLSPPTDPP